MKILIATILLSFPIIFCSSAAGAQEENSSKIKFFGVGGWLDGKNCPGIELFWERSSDEAKLFFIMKNGKSISLGRGMAIFSPDCKYFWFTPYEGRIISIYDTSTGNKISSFSGLYPAWSPDGKKIYMSKRGDYSNHKLQLFEWSLSDRKERLVIEVTDYCLCIPYGDGVDWHPVTFNSKGNIELTYATCDEKSGSRYSGKPGKTLVIDQLTHKILNTKKAELECDEL